MSLHALSYGGSLLSDMGRIASQPSSPGLHECFLCYHREGGYPGVDGELDEAYSTWQLRLDWLGILDQLVEFMDALN